MSSLLAPVEFCRAKLLRRRCKDYASNRQAHRLPFRCFAHLSSLIFFWQRACLKKNFSRILPRKEVIQPHLPVRLPCYDFTPVTNPALGRCLQKVSSRTSGVVDFHGVTGGVYKTRERIQRSVLICVY